MSLESWGQKQMSCIGSELCLGMQLFCFCRSVGILSFIFLFDNLRSCRFLGLHTTYLLIHLYNLKSVFFSRIGECFCRLFFKGRRRGSVFFEDFLTDVRISLNFLDYDKNSLYWTLPLQILSLYF